MTHATITGLHWLSEVQTYEHGRHAYGGFQVESLMPRPRTKLLHRRKAQALVLPSSLVYPQERSEDLHTRLSWLCTMPID